VHLQKLVKRPPHRRANSTGSCVDPLRRAIVVLGGAFSTSIATAAPGRACDPLLYRRDPDPTDPVTLLGCRGRVRQRASGFDAHVPCDARADPDTGPRVPERVAKCDDDPSKIRSVV
jgi:hypothetical protein